MPWCPKCKNEYVDGIHTCGDCGCELVASLEDSECEPLTFGTQEELLLLTDFLRFSGITSGSLKPAKEEGLYELYVSKTERSQALKCVSVFRQQKAVDSQDGLSAKPLNDADEPEEMEEELPGDMANAVHLGRAMHSAESSGMYEAASKKAEEFKSGAWTLLAVGILGIAGLVLLMSGALPVCLNPATQLMTCLVMGGLFLIFIVMGVFSYRSYKVQAKKAVKESSLKEELTRFSQESFNREQIDADALIEAEDPEEMRYFKRTARMKQLISEKFLNLEEGYLDNFLDEIYPEIFGG